MNEPKIESPLLMPRRFAISLLREAQLAGAQGFLAAVGAREYPDAFFIAEDALDVSALIEQADARFAPQSRCLWAIYLHRPGLPTAPTLADFAERPELLRLTASLATKGVLQLRAWQSRNGRVVERELQIED